VLVPLDPGLDWLVTLLAGAGRWRTWLGDLADARESVRPFDDRRPLRPLARPARVSA
jgi:hypothetical protein